MNLENMKKNLEKNNFNKDFNKTPIEYLILDLDGTLVDINKDYYLNLCRRVISELKSYDYANKIPDEVLWRVWYEERRNYIIEHELGIKPDDFWDEFAGYDEPDLRVSHTNIYDDVKALVKLKKDFDLKINVLSNSPPRIFYSVINLVEEYINLRFDAKLSLGYKSEYSNIAKPNHKSLDVLLKQVVDHDNYDLVNHDSIRSKILIVGNSPESDIKLANKAGVRSALIVRKESYVLKSVREGKFLTDKEIRPTYLIENFNDLWFIMNSLNSGWVPERFLVDPDYLVSH